MPIDTSRVGVRTDPVTNSWTSADAVLYALAVGAGGTDPAGHELPLTTDDSSGIVGGRLW
jgi:hypothetical protein